MPAVCARHAVPLSRQALALLAQIPRVRTPDGADYVFCGLRDGTALREKTVQSWLWVAFRRRILQVAPFTPHDLRRTCRTGLAALGVDHVVAERVLAHRLPGVAGVYDRHDYVPEMRAALQRWADHLDRVEGGTPAGNVVEMRGR